MKRGAAQLWLERKRKERKEMIVKLSKESASLLYSMIVNPGTWWERKEWLAADSPTHEGKILRLYRWCEKHLLEPDTGAKDKNRQIIGGSFSLNNELAEIAKAHLDHYKKKTCIERKDFAGTAMQCPFGSPHYAELRAGLDGKDLATAEDAEDPEDVAILAQSEKSEG